jgi:hypothetical protein
MTEAPTGKKLFLFPSTHHVICAEKKCQEQKLSYRIIPVPHSISSQCGMAIEVEGLECGQLSMALRGEEIPFETREAW